MSKLLIDDRPLLVLPSLVRLLDSMERAVVLQQIHWLLQQPKSGTEIDGEKWVWGTYQEWCEDYFTMWSPQTLGKHIRWLEENGYLISNQHRKGSWDRTKYYRINYAMLSEDTSPAPTPDGSQEENATIDDPESQPSMVYDHIPSNLYDRIPSNLYDHIPSITETSTEPPPETSEKTTSAPGKTSSTNGGSGGRRQLDPAFATVCQQYEADIGFLSQTVGAKLGEAVDEYGQEWVVEAIQLTALAGKSRLDYTLGILKNWRSNGRSKTNKHKPTPGELVTVEFYDPFGGATTQETMRL